MNLQALATLTALAAGFALAPSHAHAAFTVGQSVVRTSGQYAEDGTILYAVYVASRTEKLERVVVQCNLPPGVRFLENVSLPAGAVFEGIKADVAGWTMDSIAPDTLAGPFLFRTKADGSVKEICERPFAAVHYDKPVEEWVEGPQAEGVLVKLESEGVLQFDQRGTRNARGENVPLEAGRSGVIVFAKPGAGDRLVTLRFKRHPVDDAKMPATAAASTWWCALYEVSVEPQVEIKESMLIQYPNRRPLPYGLLMRSFASKDLTEWTPASPAPESSSKNPHREFGFPGPLNSAFTSCTSFGIISSCNVGFGSVGGIAFGSFGSGFGGFGALGINQSDRLQASATGSQLSATFQQPLSAAQTLITDGTSNIIAILIGRR
jgi:hypothetical protein